jgi:hypothetical protein
VIYNFSPSRAGKYARGFLGNCTVRLDDFAGYKADFEQVLSQVGRICALLGRLQLSCTPKISPSRLGYSSQANGKNIRKNYCS